MTYHIFLILVFCASSIIHGSAARLKWTPNAVGQHTSLIHSRRLSSTQGTGNVTTLTNKDPGAVTVSSLKRGLNSRSRSAAAGRVAYGRPAKSDQFPSVVYLNLGDSMCTGTIIARKAVLTAAHCVRTDEGEWLDVDKIKVYYGSQVWSDSSITTVDVSESLTAIYV